LISSAFFILSGDGMLDEVLMEFKEVMDVLLVMLPWSDSGSPLSLAALGGV
jgi:hypothetical protein